MSFYFQPPIFAVQPPTCVQPVVLAPAPAVVPAAYYYYTAVQATATYTTPPLIQVYTTAPMVSAAALADSQRPGLHIRIIYYGHEEPGREARPGRLWCRATDARYAGVPTGSRLREDISRLAELHNLAQARWRQARMVVAAAWSAGPVIAAGLGPVLDDDVGRVLELHRDVAAGDEEHEHEHEHEHAAEAERRRVLETSLAGGQRVFLTVCMDDDELGRRAGPLLNANGRDE